MSKQAKVHGRRVHRPGGGGCDTGLPVYRTKQDAAAAGPGEAKRCDRCRQWHNEADKRGRRSRGGRR